MADEVKDTRAYKDTLNLPKTDFPMMPPQVEDRVRAERKIIDGWRDNYLYDQTRTSKHGAFRHFTLHDGPPYANGDIHMGHAVNKVLKDILVRWKTMLGFDAQFVPGWDCHGLPIEQAVEKEHKGKTWSSRADFREECRLYAQRYVEQQAEQFRLLGINADFDNPYLTTQRKYEDGVLSLLEKLVGAGVVYRDKKPVHWCIKHRTALADAELEYKDVTETAAYVNFLVESSSTLDAKLSQVPWKNFVREGIKMMVWTTTPWTIPANRAIAVNPDNDYVLVNLPAWSESIIIGAEAAAKFTAVDSISNPFKGSELLGLKYKSYDGTVCPVISARFVTATTGTGLVHIAPGHGPEDFAIGKANGIEVKVVVDGDGKYDGHDDVTVPGSANEKILGEMQIRGMLHQTEKVTHSVAHCWRCHRPIIFRATEQWFIKAESGTEVNNRAISHARASKWHPESGLNRFEGMLKTRPDWCISRQRLWGIPIPYFVNKDGEAIMTPWVIAKVRQHFLDYGSNSWYTDTPEQMLGDITVRSIHGMPQDLEKGTDILDVWFESGASHEAVLAQGGVLDYDAAWDKDRDPRSCRYPADVYLEGSDQHRGWFQSSMLTAYTSDSSPAKTFITHGFVLDKDGRKMSKELGNVIKVTDAINRYGTDVVRFWVASVDYTNDMTCSDELFRNTVESYRKIRNTFRYLLSNLYDFPPTAQISGEDKDNIEYYMRCRLSELRKDVFRAYEAYDFKTVAKLHYDFYNIEVSAFYAKAAKDRLYCEYPSSPDRVRAQKMCLALLWSGTLTLAPIMPILCEETWQAMRKLPGGQNLDSESVHLTSHMYRNYFAMPAYTGGWTELVKLLPSVTVQLDTMKKEKGLTNPLDAEVVVTVPSTDWDKYGHDFEDACGVGCHSLRYSADGKLSAEVVDAREKYPKCERSRKRRPDVGSHPSYPTLSKRDAEVMEALKNAT